MTLSREKFSQHQGFSRARRESASRQNSLSVQRLCHHHRYSLTTTSGAMPSKTHQHTKMRGLLPSAIEDEKESDPKMKRNAREIEGDTPKVKAKDGPNETQSKPNPTSKRISINREEIAKVMMAQSQAARQATLGLPFQARNEIGKKVPGPNKPQSTNHKQPVYDGATKGRPALSDEAIAAILRYTNPECNKAQTWVHAHEFTKAIQERMKAKMEEREDLRKKIYRKLHAQSMVNNPAANPTNLQAVRGDQVDDDKLTPMERVQRAHDRLQKALAEILDV
ncbi:uncharacterized protein NFIA_090060 [Aspergillus fischeri NRRL 181]|uniref:Uncharacterized protein n=1 Tax=Neosartorya fischeri (strain ATCC 1020 / DSM 3700 / CBS 544.65 / FGSC A1164 / JCM 1740 / NRRL 181 / WB 181) TaxID=331117 RepID=A1DI41_NEOFI|nr:conserved hypothetical protein [Aspergillus fischeri NRRL 181]EAW19048.1 conserved hypothetical protein [Aspergillus fischeri NRRL 181]